LILKEIREAGEVTKEVNSKKKKAKKGDKVGGKGGDHSAAEPRCVMERIRAWLTLTQCYLS
jgi:hypothetical protein